MSRDVDTVAATGRSLFGFTLIRTRELAALRARASRPPEITSVSSAQAPAQVVRELIRLADRLPDMARSGLPADADPTGAFTRWLDGRAHALLSACDVARIEETGVIDTRRHEVVGTRAAPTADLAHHIADTVRPGYSWQGQLLRLQQVIAYVPADGQTRENQE